MEDKLRGIRNITFDCSEGHISSHEAADKLLSWHEQEIAKARIDELDRLIDVESKTFNQWSQTDIANFFVVVGRRYRELEGEEPQDD